MKKKLPDWLKKTLPPEAKRKKTRALIKKLNLTTVCQQAHCPNIGECFARGTATFMILGETCTRNCRFCAVKGGDPDSIDLQEPANIARAVEKLQLSHVVITSVTRDDLKDGGVHQFISTILEIKKLSAEPSIEILTPDFKGEENIFRRLAEVDFEVFNHNVETVPTLYQKVRPQADYNRSLKVLDFMKKIKSGIVTKSGIMLGLGETKTEVKAVLKDLYEVNCDIITIGQYLQPSSQHLEVQKFVTPEEFKEYKQLAEDIGFKAVASGPFVRSSYKSRELFNKAKGEV